MKKYFLSIVALAGMLFATSCQESLVEPQVGGTTTFTVQVPDAMGTKAIGDASIIDRLYVAVYPNFDETLTVPQDLTAIYKTHVKVENGTATVALNLIQDQKYDIVFWAQNGTSYVNETSELLSIPMNQNFHNNEKGAAFFHFEKNFTPEGYAKGITLRRPFAQLNLGTTKESLKTNLGDVTLSKSTIFVSSVATSFNTITGEGVADAVTSGTYEAAIAFDQTLTVAGKEYVYVSMDYLPVAVDQGQDKATVNITATIETNKGNIVHNFTSVPVKENYRTNIVGNLISSSTDFNVVVDDRFVDENGDNVSDDNNILVVENAAAAQAALDNAKPGDVIELVAGVNYGTLLIRPVEGKENTITGCDYLVYRNEMLRKVENLTIIGAPGATVDAIKVVAGYVKNSGSTGYVVDIKNLVINSVEFTDKHTNAPHSYASPIFFDLSYINVDGLTVQNCKLIGNNDKMNFVYFYGSGNPNNSSFKTAAKNVVIKDNVVDGIARLCELRQTENVTISGNKIKNTAVHGILLSADNGTYSGNVTITENTADSIHERFVRMAGAGDAVVVIKDNVITNYLHDEADFIKVAGSNDYDNKVTIENNTLINRVVNKAQELQTAIDGATGNYVIALGADITRDVTVLQKEGVNLVIDGMNYKYDGTINVDGDGRDTGAETLTIRNIKFNTTENDRYFIYVHKRDGSTINVNAHNLYVEDCTFTGNETSVAIRVEAGAQLFNLNVENCTAENMHSFHQGPLASSASFKKVSSIGGRGINVNSSFGSLYFENCKFEATKDDGYGLRVDCQREGIIEMMNSEFKAYNPVYMRYISHNITLKFDENTKLSLNNNSDHSNQIYIKRGNGETGQVFSNRSFNCNETLNMNN